MSTNATEGGVGEGAVAGASTEPLVGGETVRQLVDDVQRLVTFAVETGQLPETVNIELVYSAARKLERGEELSPKEFADLMHNYQVLERRIPTITARTLAATEPEEPGRIRTSPTGRYLLRLWAWTGGVVLAILVVNVFLYMQEVARPPPGEALTTGEYVVDLVREALEYLEPFFYGALGAFVFVLRVSEERLRTREFDPARAPEHVNRLVLGTLAGGSIILFIEQIPGDEGSAIQISAAALGFLAGYSVDFLFQTLDRAIRAILPKVGLDTMERRGRRRRDEEAIKRYQALLDDANDEDTKKLLREIIDDLQAR